MLVVEGGLKLAEEELEVAICTESSTDLLSAHSTDPQLHSQQACSLHPARKGCV